MATTTRGPGEAAAAVADVGWTILEGVVAADVVDALTNALHALETSLGTVPADNRFEGRDTLRVYNLLARGDVFAAVPLHPNVLAVVEAVLDTGCLVSSLSSIAIGPGEKAQPWHADDQLLPLPRPHVPIVCNTMWALTEFTEANGATRLVPGSHRQQGFPEPFGEYDHVVAEMSAGSVLVWDGSLWHAGGANTTDSTRVGIAMNYCAGWIRQQENQQLGIPPAVVAGFPKRLQRLVGYGVYNGLVGHIDKTDPRDLLPGGSDGPAEMLWDKVR